ncbi:1,6-anhydro-N-acetylmuramyl-L-alanine amidase AmpD [Variovorax sp. PCZ-1]|uniref:1,6-anhydro-N-acetylmuramyl-L-alanine amidase AmpD n=1 Tax=Variovorax sp. PCZ-1 TaxID=2835533 RepID=UPI001BCC73B6|nr:1,6-anhydro-N-acetylmuramyl-L-alanine amidase AmpD [Variovorax sp. PCZ-1]MBS7806390.1 1,6-anhydro-N-acetylmuramyl-L-alanine amidase AmpD [Variovorax sp. PCZ-1]
MKAKAENVAAWQSGWLSTAQRLDSPNFGARPAPALIDLIVVHSISLPPGIYGGSQVQKLFTNQLDWSEHPYFERIRGMQVSSHFYIERSGKLWQFVSADDRAWHAGQSSFMGRDNCNDFSVGIELEGLEGQLFEATQYQSLSFLCQHLQARYPISHVVGHEHIAPGRKFDPGAGFDWPGLQKTVGWSPQCFPALSF